MGGVAFGRIAPVGCVETEEEFDVPHGIGLGTVHVAEEEVTELDWVDSCEQKTPLGELAMAPI